MDHLNLAEDQREKLRQFTEFTHMSDYDVAVGTLASLNWNVEQAIEAHLMHDVDVIEEDPEIIETVPAGSVAQSSRPVDVIDIESNDMPSARGRRRIRSEEDSVNNQIDDDQIRGGGNNEPARRGSAIPRQGRRAPAEGASSSGAGPSYRRRGPAPSLPLGARNGPSAFESDDDDIMEEDVYEERAQMPPRINNGRTPMIPDGFTSVPDALRNFVSVFASRFCNTPATQAFMPPFYTDTLQNALKEAFENPNGDQRRPLVFYINNDRSIASNIFASQVLCSEAVCSLIRHQYLMYPWDISSEENLMHLLEDLQTTGLAEMRNLIQRLALHKVESFPLLIVIVRERNSYRMADYCCGTDTTDQVIEKLCHGVEDYTTIRLNEANERRERLEREALMNQQQAEYDASLAADKARIEAKQREIEEQRRAEEERIRAEEEEAMRRQLVASTLPSEPAATEADIINVKFRLPEGGQDMRRFRKAESIQIVIDYLSSKGYCPERFKYFNSDFPKKEVTKHFDLSKTMSEAKWPAREQIFVEEI